MEDDNVYYIHVRGYKHYLHSEVLVDRFLNSPLSKDIKNKEQFKTFMLSKLKYNITQKSKDEQELDIIISKKMLEHIKEFFNKDDSNREFTHNDIPVKLKLKSFKRKNTKNININMNIKNKTQKRKFS